MDPDGSLLDSGLVQRHGSHPAAIQCWTIRMRSERAHHYQRRYHSEQLPELWSVFDHWTAKPLCNRQPVVFYKVHGNLRIQPPNACPATLIAVRWISFFFCIIHSTERKMVIIPEFTGMGRSPVIGGLSEFWSTAKAICLDIDRA